MTKCQPKFNMDGTILVGLFYICAYACRV